MKLFKTSDIRVVAECQELLGFDFPSVRLTGQTDRHIATAHITLA